MASRKLPPEREENRNKRQRHEDTPSSLVASFDSLNTDCKVNAFSFLALKDLNNVSLCSKQCLEARNNESLNQERTGTLIFTEKTTERSLRKTIRKAIADGVFGGNIKSLEVVGIDKICSDLRSFPTLAEVNKLRILPPKDDPDFEVSVESLEAAIRLCPNATEVDLNDVKVSSSFRINHVIGGSNVQRLLWNECNLIFRLKGLDFPRTPNLTELCLNGAILKAIASKLWSLRYYGSMEEYCGQQIYFLDLFPNVQRLSIQGARIKYPSINNGYTADDDPLPQEFIIKFVRLHRNLRWLRSDLSAENVAMLQEERPDVTFVSE